jgi:hypothetical protein
VVKFTTVIGGVGCNPRRGSRDAAIPWDLFGGGKFLGACV